MKVTEYFEEEKGLITFRLSGDIDSEDISELTEIAEKYLGKNYKCILDITEMGTIPTPVAKEAVDIATDRFANGFAGYCLIASGMFLLMITMLASESFKRDHLASAESEALEKLQL